MVTKIDRNELPNDVDALKSILIAETSKRDERITRLEQENRLLRKALFAPKSERRPSSAQGIEPGQMHLLFPEIVEAAERVADEKKVQGSVELSPTRSSARPKRRRAFPSHLPVIRTTFELPEDQLKCSCGQELSVIGEEVSKELERLEIAVVHEIARKKYACKQCECGVKVARGPDRVIDKGLLGVGFLANLLIERFAHHMPYHRLESKYKSEGISLARSVLCESAVRCAEILAPIAEQIRKDALATGFIQTDDTPVVIQVGSKNRSRQGRVWVYRGLGGQIYFDVTESRTRDGPISILRDFHGYMQADAYTGYNCIYKAGDVIEVGCWAHARRYFVNAEETEGDLAREALSRIGELYSIERHAKEAELPPEQVRDLRRAESLPRLQGLNDWMTATLPQVLSKGPLAKAINYAQSNWKALKSYCDDGRLDIDNNAAERALRQIAVGRKNWIFFGNERGGQAAGVLYSLIATCREHEVDMRTYLRDVLLRIAKVSDVRELTPYGWKERWAKVVEDHRASILERLLPQIRS